MSDLAAWAVTLAAATCVVTFHYWLRASFKADQDERRARQERYERESAEMAAMRCEMWRRMGTAEHKANCQRCLGHERGRA